MFSILHTVYSTPEAIIASHLTRSPSSRGRPRFSGDRATCLAIMTLDAESSRIMQARESARQKSAQPERDMALFMCNALGSIKTLRTGRARIGWCLPRNLLVTTNQCQPVTPGPSHAPEQKYNVYEATHITFPKSSKILICNGDYNTKCYAHPSMSINMG